MISVLFFAGFGDFEYPLKQHSADVTVTYVIVTSPVESTVEVEEYNNTAHLDGILVNQI